MTRPLSALKRLHRSLFRRLAGPIGLIDCDLQAPTRAALEFFYPRIVPRGLLVLHNYASGVGPAFRKRLTNSCVVNPRRCSTSQMSREPSHFAA